jgi:hypothetical protein
VNFGVNVFASLMRRALQAGVGNQITRVWERIYFFVALAGALAAALLTSLR